MEFAGLNARQQRERWETRAMDTRPRISAGFPQLDELLNRGGLGPGELIVLGGRTHTRKSTVMLNMTAKLLRSGVPVGFCGLDEPTASYIAKLASVFTRLPHRFLEDTWDDPHTQKRLEEDFWPHAAGLSVTEGHRPSFADLSVWLDMAEVDCGARPRIVFVDYIALLGRDKYHGQDVTRIPRVFEELQVWTSTQDIVTVALHQVARGGHGRDHLPMRLEHLKYGGEEFADIVFGTYRPALELLGNLTREQAELEMQDDFDEEKYEEAVGRAKRYEKSTFLQLLKNRPGTDLLEAGIELLSPTKAMFMEPAEHQPFTERGEE